jgi:hypothetical protein
MSYTCELRHEAAAEFTNSYIWYEEQQDNLGDKLIADFYSKLNQICKNPHHYKTSYKNYHEALTDKFPFLIVCQIDEDKKKIIVMVMAIFHTSRNPKKKFRK